MVRSHFVESKAIQVAANNCNREEERSLHIVRPLTVEQYVCQKLTLARHGATWFAWETREAGWRV